MAATDVRPKITLACQDCKHRNYITKKNRRNDPDRLELKKFCPNCRAHTERYSILHNEIENACFLEHLDVLALFHALDQRPRDFGAGLISVRMHDAPP